MYTMPNTGGVRWILTGCFGDAVFIELGFVTCHFNDAGPARRGGRLKGLYARFVVDPTMQIPSLEGEIMKSVAFAVNSAHICFISPGHMETKAPANLKIQMFHVKQIGGKHLIC